MFMLLEKVWRLKFSVILVLVLLLVGCELQTNENFDESNIKVKGESFSIVKEIEKFKDVKFGLGEKFFVEGIDFFSTMNYERAIYSFNKSIFYNPIPSETKYFLGKSYFNAGRIRNSIEVFEEIKDSDLADFVIPKLSSIYSKLSLQMNYDLPLSYFTLTNIKGLVDNRKVFYLPTTVRFFDKGVVFNSFYDNSFFVIDDIFNLYKFFVGERIIDVWYDNDEKVFWLLGFSKVYKYSEGWFNLNILNVNFRKFFSYNGVNFKRICVSFEKLYLLDTISKKVMVVDRDDGEIIFTFPDEAFHLPTDMECDGENVFISDSNRIVAFSVYGEKKFSISVDKVINGFCLFGDNFVIATDDGIFVVSRNGELLSTISTNKFDDVVIGKEKKMYAINTERNEIEVFANYYLLTYNLDVDIKGIFVQSFPMIGVLVGIRNIQQDVPKNLRGYNFEVLESGVSVLLPEVEQTYSFLKKKSLYIVVERSKEVYDNLDIIKSFIRRLLEELKPSDYVNIVLVGNELINMGKMNISVLYPLDFLDKNFRENVENYKLLDGIYYAITEQLYSVRNNAILVITSGNLDNDNSVRDFFTVWDYAYNNFIPVYVISLSNNVDLKRFSEDTGGRYYDSIVLFSPEIFLRDYSNPKVFRYLLVFKSLYENIYPDTKLVDVEVRVRYNNLFGKDKVKYIFPKVKKSQE